MPVGCFYCIKKTDHRAALFSHCILEQLWEKRHLVLCAHLPFAFHFHPFAILTNLLSPPKAAFFRYTLEIACLNFAPRNLDLTNAAPSWQPIQPLITDERS